MSVKKADNDRLASEIARVATAMELQNSLRKKFLMGVTFGIGTALGASVIASILVLVFAQALQSLGLDPAVLDARAVRTVEDQIRAQSPQD